MMYVDADVPTTYHTLGFPDIKANVSISACWLNSMFNSIRRIPCRSCKIRKCCRTCMRTEFLITCLLTTSNTYIPTYASSFMTCNIHWFKRFTTMLTCSLRMFSLVFPTNVICHQVVTAELITTNFTQMFHAYIVHIRGTNVLC